ncbi:ScbA/BarX family gamma-butyrolactone biosynthesis protein [Kitasatospora sp. NPDC088351]|uniref:ScbA/BarX family gamma-butyrolactone biosynthesis protein n=1 Tax=Kitasatospora sp. NPDC088351 TaxID=3155180 RepID=UPI00341813AF
MTAAPVLAGPTPPGARLTFDRTIPRHLVHRAAVAEVFVTDAVALGGDRFLVGAQWPRDHALYHPDPQGVSDPLLFAETIRQALVCLAHWHYGVPLTHRFVGSDMDFEITDPGALRVGTEPLRAELLARWHWVDNRPPRRFGMRLEVVLSIAGRECGRGGLRVVALDERTYRVLRGRRSEAGPGPAGPVAGGTVAPEAARRRVRPWRVGRLRGKDSVLVPGPSPREWRMLVDLDHAILFDHPTDHVPLMALLEGVRQLGHLLVHDPAAGPPVVGPRALGPQVLLALTTRCLAFAELDEPLLLAVRGGVTRASGRGRLAIDVLQGNTVLMTSETDWGGAGPGDAMANHGLRPPFFVTADRHP